MAQQKKATFLKQGNMNNGEKEEKIKAERDLQGNNSLVYTPPENLSEEAQAYYKFIVTELEIANILSNLDIMLLSQLSETLTYIDQCSEEIDKNGLLVEGLDRNGEKKLIENPASGIKIKYLKEFKSLSGQIGLSPSSRAQLVSLNIKKQEQDDDPLLDILKGVHGEGIVDNWK